MLDGIAFEVINSYTINIQLNKKFGVRKCAMKSAIKDDNLLLNASLLNVSFNNAQSKQLSELNILLISFFLQTFYKNGSFIL